MVATKNISTSFATKTRLMMAASAVVARKGVAAMTLENVAEEAGVSKGGLLYHFPSKQDLVKGLLEFLIDGFESAHSAVVDRAQSPGRWTRAYIKATVRQPFQKDDASAALLSALALDPSLLEPLRIKYREWMKEILQDGIDPVEASIIRLAVDGLWFSALLDLGVPEPKMVNKVVERLLAMAKEKRETKDEE